ncbi:MAG: hypothetical protein WAU41_07510 [Gaiellaceae bacterium]
MTPPFLHVEIEAPDGPAALELEYRLAHLSPTSVGRDGRWLVELDASTDALGEIAGAVGVWLGGIGERSTTVNLDGRTLRMQARAATPRRSQVPRYRARPEESIR